MRICQKRNALQNILFFIHWQLWPVLLALPGHFAFAARGLEGSTVGVWDRLILAGRLIRVHLAIPCAHAPMELLHIVEEVITLPTAITGAVVECGSYLGGSTAKLSLAAAAAKRTLIVCDSFQGLPEVGRGDELEGREPFQASDFTGRLEHVQNNVSRYGNLAVVDFVPGWYHESLPTLSNIRVSCLFLDVDLQESIKTCLSALWKLVEPGCKVFIHDVDRKPVVEPFQDKDWWLSNIGRDLPELVGDEKGLGWQKPMLGYVVKS